MKRLFVILVVVVTLAGWPLYYKLGKRGADRWWQQREQEIDKNHLASFESMLKSEEQIETQIRARVPVCVTAPKPRHRLVEKLDCPKPWTVDGDRCVDRTRSIYTAAPPIPAYVPCSVDGYSTWCSREVGEQPICPSGHYCTMDYHGIVTVN